MTSNQGSNQPLDELYREVQALAAAENLPGAAALLERMIGSLGEDQTLEKAKLLGSRGYMLASMQSFGEARESFRQARDIFRDEDSPVNMAIQIGNIGSVYRDAGDYAMAVVYYEEALVILKEHDYQPAVADQHSNIAYACSQKGDVVPAIEHFKCAEKIYAQLGDQHKLSQCRQNIETLTAQS